MDTTEKGTLNMQVVLGVIILIAIILLLGAVYGGDIRSAFASVSEGLAGRAKEIISTVVKGLRVV